MLARPSFVGSLLAVLALMLTASGAEAVTILATPHASENDLNDVLAADGYTQAGSMAQLNANQSPADTFLPLGAASNITLLIEDAGYRNNNELGIYSVLDNSITAVLFQGSDSAPDGATLQFGAGGLEYVNGVTVAAGFGSAFGFYLTNQEKAFTWFSETEKNGDGYEHFVAFEENGTVWGGFEDLRGGGDQDFNDLVFSMRGVSGNPIPEPSAALVFVLGACVMGSVTRRKAI